MVEILILVERAARARRLAASIRRDDPASALLLQRADELDMEVAEMLDLASISGDMIATHRPLTG